MDRSRSRQVDQSMASSRQRYRERSSDDRYKAEGSGSAASRPRPYSPTPATHHDHHHHAHAGRPSDHADDSARHAPHCGGDEDGIDGDAYQTLLKMDEFKGDEVKLKKYGVEYVRTLSIQDKINTHRQAGENAWQKLRAAGDAKEDVLDNVREAYRAGDHDTSRLYQERADDISHNMLRYESRASRELYQASNVARLNVFEVDAIELPEDVDAATQFLKTEFYGDDEVWVPGPGCERIEVKTDQGQPTQQGLARQSRVREVVSTWPHVHRVTADDCVVTIILKPPAHHKHSALS